MNGIYITNMKKPTGCAQCRFFQSLRAAFGMNSYCLLTGEHEDKYRFEFKEYILPKCPIIEIIFDERSKTFEGIAAAMADQWGCLDAAD